MTHYDLKIEGAACVVWPDGPAWDGTPAAAIGRLDIADADAGAAMLRQARSELAARGRGAVLAPMDGDTWHAYRSVVDSDGSPPFLLEPVSGVHDGAALRAAGFAPVAHYASSRTTLSGQAGGAAPRVDGVRVAAWDGQGADALLDRLFALAGSSFADKMFFKSIELTDFRALYLPFIGAVDPRLVLFAQDTGGDLQGFLFGLPDWSEGPKPATAILKTYASLRGGVGHLLAHAFHARAAELGYTHVVHALMHEANVSLDRSARHGGSVFRRYALFGARG